MEFVGVDTDNGSLSICETKFLFHSVKYEKVLTVFLVHLLDLPEVSPVLNNIIIELIPWADHCDSGTGKSGERMKPDIVDSSKY